MKTETATDGSAAAAGRWLDAWARRAARGSGAVAATEAVVADPGGRAPEIDAIRDWAALSVVCYHIFWKAFGAIVPGLRTPLTAPFLAGRFDVILFFILSGDALSFPFFHGGGSRYLQRAALKRYPRLTVPIVVVTAVTAIAMAAGLAPTQAASAFIGREDWLGVFARFHASGASAIRFAFFYVYRGGYPPNYLPFLWTMPIEMFGSFVLLLALFVYPRIRGAGWLVAALAWVLIRADDFTGCFLIGLLLGRARAEGVYGRLPRVARRRLAPACTMAALALVGRHNMAGDQALPGLAGLGTLLLASLYANPAAVRFLARDRFSQFLGRISYLLYLWHYTVVVTLMSGLVLLAIDDGGDLEAPAAIGIGVLTVAVSVGLARATLPVEGWARRANALLLRRVWREDGASGGDRPALTRRLPTPRPP